MLKVGLLGLGAMGSAMAARLVEAGFPLSIWNRTASRTHAVTGAFATKTPRDCADGADVVITMLADAAALESVLLGPSGLLAGLGKKAIVCDMSTMGRAAAIDVAARVANVGASFLDAPVSGTIGPARRGELLAFVGGDVRDVERARPVLSAMCKRILHVGGVGQGQAMKVVVNGLGAHHLVAFASMLSLGIRAGLTREMLVEAFTTGAFASPSYMGKKAKVLARDYSPEFTLDLTLKDIRLNEDLQKEAGIDLPVVHEVRKTIEKGVTDGLGAQDLFAIEKIYE